MLWSFFIEKSDGNEKMDKEKNGNGDMWKRRKGEFAKIQSYHYIAAGISYDSYRERTSYVFS